MEKVLKLAPNTKASDINIGGVPIAAAVLEDGTRVLSARGVTKAFGAKRGGAHWRRMKADPDGANLPVFISAKNLKPFIDKDLEMALISPIMYEASNKKTGHGYPAELLPQICEVWLKARDQERITGEPIIHPSQQHIADAAEMLMRGLAHVGIVALVDEATGNQANRARNALEMILEQFLSKELGKWAKRFPDEFFEQLFRLRGWRYDPMSVKRPSVVGNYIKDIVYYRLAPGVLNELERTTPRDAKGRLKHHYHRRLTEDVGHPRLQEHLSGVLALMKISRNWDEFKRHLNRVYKRQPQSGDNLELEYDSD